MLFNLNYLGKNPNFGNFSTAGVFKAVPSYAILDLFAGVAGDKGVWDLGFMILPIYRAFVIGAAIVVCLTTWFIIEKTRLGAIIRAGVFAGLTHPQLAAVLACFVFEARRNDDGQRRARMPDAVTSDAVTQVRRIWRDVSLVERDFRLERGPDPEIGCARAASYAPL